MALETYDLVLVLVGLVLLGISILPRFLKRKPISLPIFFVGFGLIVFRLPLGLPPLDPVEHSFLAERLTELGVIVALMGVGLKIERPPSLKGWLPTWRLLGITMPLSIAGAALLGWWAGGLLIPSAVLLGACIAPTDPVLASEVQASRPQTLDDEKDPDEHDTEDPPDGQRVRIVEEDPVRFALTSEAGLNDGLAFPFTNLAILLAVGTLAPQAWLAEWLIVHVTYKIAAGTALGIALGWALAYIIFHTVERGEVAKALAGLEALAGVLIVYGVTEYAGAYGFIAVFVAAIMIREHERAHRYHEDLHQTVEIAEHVLMALIMFAFGGIIASGLFDALTLPGWLTGIAIVFLVRPLAGLLGMTGRHGTPQGWARRGAIAFFGVRGIATFYYLAHALNTEHFAGIDAVWALAGVVVLTSIIVHGILATPLMNKLDEATSDQPTLEKNTL